MKKLKLNERSSFKETEDFWQALYLVQLKFPGFTFEIRDCYYAVCEAYEIDDDPRAHSDQEKQLVMDEVLNRLGLPLTDNEEGLAQKKKPIFDRLNGSVKQYCMK